ncbi:CRISPR-associated helicase/endonuclease Cas3 [Chloroflexus aggregans]|uniref:Metal dependent phosphohydrolase n=1 Tax=Chloroflexus aggregans (strain MD-66 / DSM 9485) TaxID=326427 RepID=B8G4A2_CHLAD|nr:CRISPR-associated helicase/endonuclease Cas3 [Chloroflexus aggregans]ACL23508.1 metal dependent phosphohydrolase [Chloroflexus aggregans DSM 9485]
MNPSPWPHWIDNLLAKSQRYGGETLAAHTWAVLCRLADLYRLRPQIANSDSNRLWHCLYWAAFLHDFGKAARGFQQRLRGGPTWPHRHEVLSLAFVDAIAHGLSEDEQRWVVAAIVSHHRDEAEIAQTYPLGVRNDPLIELCREVDDETVRLLDEWLATCANPWREALGLAMVVEEITPQSVTVDAKRVRYWLQVYHDWVAANDPVARVPGILLRGLITTADHMASAHLHRVPPPITGSWSALAKRLLPQGEQIYEHQRQSGEMKGQSALLMAPTGSGKTEAALYWALGDGTAPPARIFYTLPYQASMNAMYDRLRQNFGDELVGLQHGRAAQALYARFREGEEWSAAARRVQWEKNLNILHARPLKVLSPYQLLKALFQLRGFEAMLTDYAQAAFVFDEIHAYEPERLALITGLMRYLREQFAARFFVMSATFPQLIRRRLTIALGNVPLIRASPEIFTRFRRHRLFLREGEITDPTTITEIVDKVRAGRQVLVCANTVARAQALRDQLAQAGLTDDQLLLIHSRFTHGDRTRLEQRIRSYCGSDVAERPPLVLVATQVVEVSLDIDLDTIYTDPAPLEALLQRFGRVNRRGAKGICPVYVFRQPNDGQGVYGRDRDPNRAGHIVRVTLAELEPHNGEIIDESAINDWLDRIYADPVLSQQWTEAYQRMAQQVELIINGLRPFQSDEQREDEFEQMFDGVEVVPQCFEQAYVDCLVQERLIEANDYLVSISKQRFAILRSQGKLRPAEEAGKRRVWVAQLPYDERNGLSFSDIVIDPDWS